MICCEPQSSATRNEKKPFPISLKIGNIFVQIDKLLFTDFISSIYKVAFSRRAHPNATSSHKKKSYAMKHRGVC